MSINDIDTLLETKFKDSARIIFPVNSSNPEASNGAVSIKKYDNRKTIHLETGSWFYTHELRKIAIYLLKVAADLDS